MGEVKQRKTVSQKEEIAEKMKRKKKLKSDSKTGIGLYGKMAGLAVAVVALLGVFWKPYTPETDPGKVKNTI